MAIFAGLTDNSQLMVENTYIVEKLQEAFAIEADKPRRTRLTQAGLAAFCGVSEQAVSKWVRTGQIHRTNIPRVCQYFRKPVSWLMPDIAGELRSMFYDTWPNDLDQRREVAMQHFVDAYNDGEVEQIPGLEHITSSQLVAALQDIPPETDVLAIHEPIAGAYVDQATGRGIRGDHGGLVPLISQVQAGDWAEAEDPFPPGQADDWMPCPTRHSEHTFALRVEGDSMTSPYPGQRSYPDGTVIFVDPEVAATSGKRVVAKLLDSNEVTFKTYIEDAGVKSLKPINPRYRDIDINGNCQIIGVVIGSFYPE